MIPYDNHASNSSGYSGYQNGYQISTLPYGYRREILSGNTYYYYDGYIQTLEGVVTVSGVAGNAAEKSLVTKLIKDVDGVMSVENNMSLN